MVYAEHNWHDYEAYERMVRIKDYLYVFNGRPNLSNGGPADSKKSPTQKSLNNVASHPRYQKQFTEFRKLFRNWQQETGDTMPENLTKDWYDRETGEPLKNGNYNIRDTMPGK